METLIALVAAAAVAALVVREATHRRETARLRALLAEAKIAVSESNELANVGSLVSELAQELKAPLQGVLANTELMIVTAEEGEQRAEELHDIRQNATRAVGIVRNLLAYTDTTNLKRSWHDMNDLVSRAAIACRTELGDCGFGIDVAPPTRLPLVYVDGRQLEKVLATFLGRAGRALGDASEPVRVSVAVTTERTSQLDDRLLIDIDDDGPPVPLWDESFGDGGVAACTRIVEAHGGSVTIEDRPRGLHMRLEFPITADAAAAAAAGPESPSHAVPPKVAPTNGVKALS